MQAMLQAARSGCARTNNATRVGGGKTLRRFAALYIERLRSLRRALNMNAKYAGDQPDTAQSARQRAVQCAYRLCVCSACPPEAPFQGMGGLIVHASGAAHGTKCSERIHRLGARSVEQPPAHASSRVLTDSFHCARRRCQRISAHCRSPARCLRCGRQPQGRSKRRAAGAQRNSSKQRDGRSDHRDTVSAPYFFAASSKDRCVKRGGPPPSDSL